MHFANRGSTLSRTQGVKVWQETRPPSRPLHLTIVASIAQCNHEASRKGIAVSCPPPPSPWHVSLTG